MSTLAAIARLQRVIWTLIYGGALLLVLGLSTARLDEVLGWSMVVCGGVIAAVGVALVIVRSRLQIDED